ncbi:MAG: hypothetical protein R3338_03575 [Thermoanaerobaculia bacterium]|nr:hypothetical protein [Thermoanaerobaculia bacterium]
MDHRYVVRKVPEEEPLRCDICNDAIVSSTELQAARSSDVDLVALVEPTILKHLTLSHHDLFNGNLEILFEPKPEASKGVSFPDQELVQIEHVQPSSPPRSSDE